MKKSSAMIKILRLVLMTLSCLPLAVYSAASTSVIKEDGGLITHSRYVFDEANLFTFENISIQDESVWQHSNEKIISKGYSKASLWIQFEIENQLENNDWLIEVGYPIIDYVDIRVEYANRTEFTSLGDRYPFEDRAIKHRNFVVPLSLEQHEKAIVTLLVKTGSSYKVPLRVWSRESFDQQHLLMLLLSGTFFGFMIVMIVYNLVLYFFIRELRYLFYIAFASSFVVFQASLGGLGYQFFWSNSVDFNEHILPVSLGITLFFETLFVSSFLNLKKEAPKTNKFLKAVMTLLCVLSLVSIFRTNREAIQPLIAIGVPVNILFFIFGLQRWQDNSRAAKIFTLAWFFPVLSGSYVGLVGFGVLEHTALSEYGMAASMVIAVVMLSFALGESIAQQRSQQIKTREEANRLIKQMEEERDKSREITLLNEVISEARDEAEKRRKDVLDLLNNSSQGIVAFGEDLIVEPEFSRACLEFFNVPPGGKAIIDLIYSENDTPGRAFFMHAIKRDIG